MRGFVKLVSPGAGGAGYFRPEAVDAICDVGEGTTAIIIRGYPQPVNIDLPVDEVMAVFDFPIE